MNGKYGGSPANINSYIRDPSYNNYGINGNPDKRFNPTWG